MKLPEINLFIPKTINEAVEIYSNNDPVRIIAGGTFAINTLKGLKERKPKNPPEVLSLRKIKELKGISSSKKELRIKTMTTLTEIIESDDLSGFEVIKDACRHIATTPIRNMATIGGNLTCRYTWTELPAVMIALNADLHFRDKKNKESSVSAEDFFKSHAKTEGLLTTISIPKADPVLASYQRTPKLSPVDIPILSLCISARLSGDQLSDTKCVINNGADFAKRDNDLENFLSTTKISSRLAEDALMHLNKEIYNKGSDDYKKQLFRAKLQQGIEELLQKI